LSLTERVSRTVADPAKEALFHASCYPTGVGPSGNGTLTDLSAGFTVPCVTTPSTSVGSTCSITTTIDTVMGTNTAIAEQKRAIWELTGGLGADKRSLRLLDGGADGLSATVNNSLFAVGGLFFP
jgi:hypothetical protein